MAKLLDRSKEVKDGKLVITQQTEETVDRATILYSITQCQSRMEKYRRDMVQSKANYDAEATKVKEWKEALDMLPVEELPVIPE